MDLRSLQKSVDRANGVTDGGFNKMERRATGAARSIERTLGGIRLPPQLARQFNDLGADIGRGFQSTSRAAQIALAGISVYAIKLAADAGEIESAFDVAFKGSAKSAREFSDVLAKRVGRDAVETREAMTRLQLVLTGTGVAAEQASEMVKTLAEVGIDAGSLFNTSDAEAFQKIISGISGESEPLKAFGVVINDAALKAELLRLGFKGTAQEASESAKSVARANLIIKGLAVAQGDATRTAGSAANQTRALRAEFNAAARDLGQQLLPAFVKLTHGATDVLKAFNELPGGVQIAGLAILGFIAASGPIAGLLANLGRVIKLAKETRAAIAGIAAANAAAGASGAAGAAGAVAGGAGIAAAATVGTAVAGGALIVQGALYQKTVKNVRDATDAAIAGALTSATAQLASASKSGPAGDAAARRLGRDVANLTAEQARRGLQAAATGAPAGTVNPTTTQGGFGLSGDQLNPVGGGGAKGRKGPKDRSADIALRQQERADGLLSQATEDLARVMTSRNETAEGRYQDELAAIDRDRATRTSELAYSVKQKELTQAQADEIAVAEEGVRIGRRVVAEADRNATLAAERAELQQLELDGQETILQQQAGLARTANARRLAELALLDLAEQRAQADLEVIAATKGVASAEYKLAQQRLANLQSGRPGAEATIAAGTRGPLEDYFARLPQTADEVNEAFQNLEVQGISSLVDGLSAAAVGAANLGDVFRQTIQQMAIDANRILLQSLLSGGSGGGGGLLGGLLKIGASSFGGGIPGKGIDISGLAGLYAGGTDSTAAGAILVGEEGPEILRQKGGHQVIPNDVLRGLTRMGAPGAGGQTWAPVLHVNVMGGMSAADARRTGAQIGSAAMREMSMAKRRGY